MHNRQKAILEIISNNTIYNQAQLQEELKKKGFQATQATLSRDLRALGVIKLSGEGYKQIPELTRGRLTVRGGVNTTEYGVATRLSGVGIGNIPGRTGLINGKSTGLANGIITRAVNGGDAVEIYGEVAGQACVLSVEFSGQLGVVKTLPGHAGSVASALERRYFPSVMGSIAGDDTVLVILRNAEGADIIKPVKQPVLNNHQ